MIAATPKFYGDGFEYDRDQIRLTEQLRDVYDCLCDEQWWTLRDIEYHINKPQASISAAIRTLRRPENGGYHIERKYYGNGLHKYRLDHSKITNYKPKAVNETPRDIIMLEGEYNKCKSLLSQCYDIMVGIDCYDGSTSSVLEQQELDNLLCLVRKAIGRGSV